MCTQRSEDLGVLDGQLNHLFHLLDLLKFDALYRKLSVGGRSNGVEAPMVPVVMSMVSSLTQIVKLLCSDLFV